MAKSKRVSFNNIGRLQGLAQQSRPPQSGTMWAAPPPPTPPPAPPPPPPLPADPIADSRRAALQSQYDQTLSGLQYQEGRTRQAYGFDDSSHPFSRAAMLQRSYENRQRGTTNSMAARGMLYDGALGTRRATDTHNYDQAVDSTRRSYDDILQQIAQRRVSARTSYESGVADVGAEALDRAIAQRPDPAELPPAEPAAEPVAPGALTPAQRRAARKRMGLTDTRTATPAQIRRARRMGLL